MNSKFKFFMLTFLLHTTGLVLGMDILTHQNAAQEKERVFRLLSSLQGRNIRWSQENEYPNLTHQEGTLTITKDSFYVSYAVKVPTVTLEETWTSIAMDADELTKIRQQKLPFYLYIHSHKQDEDAVKITHITDEAPQMSSYKILHGKEKPAIKTNYTFPMIVTGGIGLGIMVCMCSLIGLHSYIQ